MPRVARALETLLDQVNGEVVGSPDGFGVHRSAMVTVTAPLDALELDSRIKKITVVATALGDVALVDVVSGRGGDLTDPFDLD